MQGRWPIVCIFIVVLSLLSSCATVTSLIEGVPRWTIKTPRATLTTLSFVAEGTAESADQIDAARDRAVDDLFQQLSEYVGYRLEEGYRRELIQQDEISDLSITITEEFHQAEQDKVTVFLLAEAHRRTINDFRRAQEERAAREGQEHLSYRDAARRAYARNQDVKAVEQYLEAARSAYQSRVPDHVVIAKEYLEEAISIVAGLNIDAQSRATDDRSFRVRVVREGRAFSSGVGEADVSFSYPVYNVAGKQVQLEETRKTDSRGFASFTVSHQGFRGSSRVTAYVKIPKIDERVEKLRDHTELNVLVSRLYRMISEKQAVFSFTVLPDAFRGTVGAAILEYDRGGNLRDNSRSLDSLIDIFSRDQVDIKKISIFPVSSEGQALQYIQQRSNGEFATGIVGSAEIVSVVASGQRIVATARGAARVVDARTLNRRAETDTVVANGIGSTAEEAKQAAFARFGEITASILLSIL